MTQPGNDPGFGDAAGEMANETEVEAPQTDASASAGGPDHRVSANEPPADDVSGVANMVEEGAPLEPADFAAKTDDGSGEEPQRDELAERTADLQRLTAEYANYRKRVERDRQLTAETERYKVLVPIIDVLDTIDRAREHGDLDEGLRGVADQLERVVSGLGLTRFGEPGDAFDPNIHEALSHIGEDAEVEVTTCKVIAKAGYRLGDRVVRAAQVLVVDPAS